MAACEHHLGHWEAAAGLYGRALAELWEAKRRRKPIERVEEVARGVAATKGIANKAAAVTEKGATERRIDFISGRLRLVERRERPPMGKILDKDAREACFENRAPPQPQPPAAAPPRAAGPPIATRPAEERRRPSRRRRRPTAGTSRTRGRSSEIVRFIGRGASRESWAWMKWMDHK